MKTIAILFIHLFFCMLLTNNATAQISNDTIKTSSFKMYVVTKNDGATFVGKIISQDAREVLIDTKKMGQVIIPKHEIKEIREIKAGDLSNDGELIPEASFASRYFLTTNGFPLKKGDSYIQYNWFGPDFQFRVAENFGIGVMTSWIGIPIIGSAKYSIELGKSMNLGLGTLLGTGSWVRPDFGLALPFAALTFGDSRQNLTFSAGFGSIFYKGGNQGRALFSIAGITKVGKKISLVFDSFIFPKNNQKNSDSYALLIPGIRWQSESNKAFQFGFLAINVNGTLSPVPFPMVQWFRKL